MSKATDNTADGTGAAGTCAGCAARDRRIAELEGRVAALEAKLGEAARAGKRQAAPFSKGPPKADPKPRPQGRGGLRHPLPPRGAATGGRDVRGGATGVLHGPRLPREGETDGGGAAVPDGNHPQVRLPAFRRGGGRVRPVPSPGAGPPPTADLRRPGGRGQPDRPRRAGAGGAAEQGGGAEPREGEAVLQGGVRDRPEPLGLLPHDAAGGAAVRAGCWGRTTRGSSPATAGSPTSGSRRRRTRAAWAICCGAARS